MVKIEALIGPSRLEAVQQVLSRLYVDGLTVTEIKGRTGPHGERAAPTGLGALLRVEVVIPAPLLPRALHDLSRALREGRPGDDLILVAPVLEALRVRTGERGEAAL